MQSLDFHVPYTPNELVPGTMKRKFDIGDGQIIEYGIHQKFEV